MTVRDHGDGTDERSRDGLPARRALLGAIGAAAGLTALPGTGTAQGDGAVETRGCGDAALTPTDWSTGAVTVQACPGSGGGSIEIETTGDVGTDRYQPPVGPQPSTFVVSDGERQTIWFTGQLQHLSCSNDALNVGVVNRG